MSEKYCLIQTPVYYKHRCCLYDDWFRQVSVFLREKKNKWKGKYYNFVIYFILNYWYSGGRQGKLPNTALECYDFTEDKWEKLPDIPSKRVFAMYTTTDKFIFSLGGLKQPATDGFSDACEVFDTEKSKTLHDEIYTQDITCMMNCFQEISQNLPFFVFVL